MMLYYILFPVYYPMVSYYFIVYDILFNDKIRQDYTILHLTTPHHTKPRN